MRIKKINKI